MNSEVEEADVPGDEDEEDDSDDIIIQRPRRSKRKLAKTKELKASISAPEISQNDIKPKRIRTSSTNSHESYDVEDDDNEFYENIESQNIIKTPKSIRRVKEQNKRPASPKKKRFSKPNPLRRASTTEMKEEKRKKSSNEIPLTTCLYFAFKDTLAQNNSEFLQILLQHCTHKDFSEGTQLKLLVSIIEILLIPDEAIAPNAAAFLKRYISADITQGNFNEKDWKIFSEKDKKNNIIFNSPLNTMENILWYHIAEVYLISIFTKSSFFRIAFQKFIGKLEKETINSRKQHKILHLLNLFLEDIVSSFIDYPLIIIEVFCKMKDTLSQFTKKEYIIGILSRITIEAISSIIYQPRRWNFELEVSPNIKKSLQVIACKFSSSLLQEDFQCSNSIESSLLTKMSDNLSKFILFCTNQFNTQTSPRVMSWPEASQSLTYVYNHIIQNFDKLWKYIILTNPKISLLLLPFGSVGIQAIQLCENSE